MAPLWPRKRQHTVIGGSNLQEQSEGRGQASNERDIEQHKEDLKKIFKCLKKAFGMAMRIYKEYQEKQRERRHSFARVSKLPTMK